MIANADSVKLVHIHYREVYCVLYLSVKMAVTFGLGNKLSNEPHNVKFRSVSSEIKTLNIVTYANVVPSKYEINFSVHHCYTKCFVRIAQ